MTGDRTTDLKRSAVMSGTGIHRLIYRDMCGARRVVRGLLLTTIPMLGNSTHNTRAESSSLTTILRAATTTWTVKRRCAVARSVFVRVVCSTVVCSAVVCGVRVRVTC